VLNSLLIRYCRLMPFHFARWRIERYLHRHLSGTTLTRAKDGFQLQVDNADFLQLRIPRDGGHDSRLMADSVPPPWRTPFHGDGGQHSILMADT
jgi:hypothetical protein